MRFFHHRFILFFSGEIMKIYVNCKNKTGQPAKGKIFKGVSWYIQQVEHY